MPYSLILSHTVTSLATAFLIVARYALHTDNMFESLTNFYFQQHELLGVKAKKCHQLASLSNTAKWQELAFLLLASSFSRACLVCISKRKPKLPLTGPLNIFFDHGLTKKKKKVMQVHISPSTRTKPSF